jgi:UDP-N-acetylglucosamine--N-acetylmuramyl-(pentapeptide) pyrophosphoryl-undecaprenol N-acetylglucosamine transferase
MREIKIAVTGGGTGGHTSPAISVINHIRSKKHNPPIINNEEIDFEFLYIGSVNGIEKDYSKKENIDYKAIKTGKVRRKITFKNIVDMFKVLIGTFQAMSILSKYKPDVLFSTGGYVSVPVVLASRWKKIPIIIHEQTVNVGLANKVGSKFADKIAITFESSKKYFPQDKVVVTGIPLREEIFTGEKDECYEIFSLDKNLPIVYITGGSQGSKFINDTIAEVLPELLKETNIIHQCGGAGIHNSYDELKSFKEALPDELKRRYVVRDYIYSELKHVFKASSLIIGRSGAGTVNECIALAKPSILIPLPGTTKDEQGENARLGESLGGAMVLYQNELNPKILRDTILSLITDKNHLNKMKEAFEKHSITNASEKIYGLILQTISR